MNGNEMSTYRYHERQVSVALTKLQELTSKRDTLVESLPPVEWSSSADKRNSLVEEISVLDEKIVKQEKALSDKRGRMDRSAMVAKKIILGQSSDTSKLEDRVRKEYIEKAKFRAEHGLSGFENKYSMLHDELNDALKYVRSIIKLQNKLQYEFGEDLTEAVDILERYGLDRNVLEDIEGLGL